MAPLEFTKGLQLLLKEVTPEDIALLLIPSSHTDWVKNAIELLNIHGLPVPSKNIYRYIPPDNVGDSKDSRGYVRNEQIPKVDPSKHYIIIDDQFETGDTVKCAINMLAEQGVKYENTWMLLAGIVNRDINPEGFFLDKSSEFYKSLRR